MATQSTYYLDDLTFALATAVYTDVALTTIAPDGYYSVSGMVRQQLNGVLMPSVVCPSCPVDCDGVVVAESKGIQGIFNIPYSAGSQSTSTGAIIVRISNVDLFDIGVLATYNGVDYNKISTTNLGSFQAPVNKSTIILDTDSFCDINVGDTLTLTEFLYSNSSFAPTGVVTPLTLTAGQIFAQAGQCGDIVMVIPKPLIFPSDMLLQLTVPCTTTSFTATINCPVELEEITACLTPSLTAERACSCAEYITYYVANVNGSVGSLGLYDFVFTDINGEFPLSDGYYQLSSQSYNWMKIVSGVITEFGNCTYTYVYSCTRCSDGLEVIVISEFELIENQIISITGYEGCQFIVGLPSANIPTQSYVDDQYGVCGDFCTTYELQSSVETSVVVEYINCNGDSASETLSPLGSLILCARTGSIVEQSSFTTTVLSCGCDYTYYYELLRCGDSLSIVGAFDTPIVNGTLVSVDGYTGCQFTVISLSANTPNALITGTLSGSCSNYCSTYLLTKISEKEYVSAYYTDCNGDRQIATVYTTASICAINDSIISSSDFTIQWLSCGCLS